MNGYDAATEEHKTGMSRFFSPANLDRYRKLAGEAIGDTERRHLLDALAREVSAFRREAARPPLARASRQASFRELGTRKRTSGSMLP